MSRFHGDVYLVFDQFEELFVYPKAEGFAAALAEVVRAPHLRVNVLLALREDALAELDVFTGRIPNVFGNYLSLERLDRAAARRRDSRAARPVQRERAPSGGDRARARRSRARRGRERPSPPRRSSRGASERRHAADRGALSPAGDAGALGGGARGRIRTSSVSRPSMPSGARKRSYGLTSTTPWQASPRASAMSPRGSSTTW